MSLVEELTASSVRVEELREGLGRVRDVVEQADSVLLVADEVLGKADDMILHATDALEQSKRWAPRVALIVGVMAVAAIGAVVVLRLRRRERED